MRLKDEAASLLTNDFLRSRPNEWDLFEELLTKQSLKELDQMTPEDFGRAIRWIDEEVKRIKGASFHEIMMLLDLIDEHEEAIAYDCLALGLRLRNVGTEDFTWGDLLAIVRQAPRSSALFRSMSPDEAMWGHTEQLLALIADFISVGNWQRSQGKKKDYPKPIPRPGVEQDKKFGTEAMSLEDAASWLGWEKK
ncbi:hypothetical protein [Streptomyces lasalocidi]|uniref:Tail assembly chaperone n=1 Tax=Streptomyces lasalocidi TaxID=324833 RepID=A0A4U5WRT6_STRLS|nr:hypothetical protein [Streptomyces lasalocidi]TKT03446.1 hypothetical protein E4U91_27365 [Streptomyces lasalocidi]